MSLVRLSLVLFLYQMLSDYEPDIGLLTSCLSGGYPRDSETYLVTSPLSVEFLSQDYDSLTCWVLCLFSGL